MKSFQVLSLFAMIAAAMAFAPNKAPQGEYRCICLYPGSHLGTQLSRGAVSGKMSGVLFVS